MFSRRRFLNCGGAALLASLAHPVRAETVPLGIQLYTLRNEAAKDLEGTLRNAYSAGFREIEFAGYFGRTATELSALAKHVGLNPISTHITAAKISAKSDEVIAFAKDLGV